MKTDENDSKTDENNSIINENDSKNNENDSKANEFENIDRVIFVSRENIVFSPMTEWIFKSMINDKTKKILSRGLIVLFEEPQSEMITEILRERKIPCNISHLSKGFDISEVGKNTLVLTMDFAQKVRIIENEGIEDNVFTVHEFAGCEGEILPVKTIDKESYEERYEEIYDLLLKVKERLGWN